jgi:hypothetical protein
MPQVAENFFKFAVVFLILGILMGLQMSISGQHSVIGAHAHTNLLGWVTSAIFGAYYAFNPAKATGRAATAHFWVYCGSVAVMVPSLYLLYSGYPAVEPLLAVSSLTGFASVLIFAYVVFTPATATMRTKAAAAA